ncbi:hypothetical protein [Paraherbaspirillum soli]|uniref:Uncharacterized protein n=1 Tax=Paraherbaspirillum soli TaxID=631222 RepID=A0ABW0M395_9BURK
MKIQLKPVFLSVFIVANALALHVIAAEENVQIREPQRWGMEDRTPQARFRTMQKENQNAYKQAIDECRRMRGPEAGECRREAKSNFDQDMRRAREMMMHRDRDQMEPHDRN